MVRNLSRGVFQYAQPPRIISYASTVGQKEGDGPFGACFDCVEPDAHFGQDTWEQAESVMQRRTVQLALDKCGLQDSDLSCICAGDLMNQCIGSTYGMRPLEIPLLGIYGACSTMAEGLLLASFLAAGGVGEYTAAVTSSHFSTAERQFRFPLSYGGQRPPTAQWTCTGSGAVILQQPDGIPRRRVCYRRLYWHHGRPGRDGCQPHGSSNGSCGSRYPCPVLQRHQHSTRHV